ncbi:YncE family protein [Zunongwangia sp. HRR-M8]|uniref:YncE family protein n=1 Tax=Zunongwangia sp. HRR-M8 TaxID=3015170 RepID=UPI0022DD2AC7|nr:DUF5074 domain-containing protein [Zunongwangia sp. HRR-M8]WBL20944.1 quinoprotein amine dehydrogenase [Zunongwangia sp. HRR-M8]
MKKILVFGAIAGSLFFSSCSSDDDFIVGSGNDNEEPVEEPEEPVEEPEEPVEEPEEPETLPYEDGVIVLNEGNMAAGSVSFLNEDLSTVENNIFKTVNPDLELGGYLQSIFFDGDLAYIISNASNIITVVNRETFEYKGVVDSGLNVPYYGAVYNGKAYVSNLADFNTGEDDFIAVIDLETLEVEETIVAGTYLDGIEEENGLIYVQGSSFGNGNSIHVFDPATNSISNTFTTNAGLNSFEIEDDHLYALSKTELQVFDLNTNEEIRTIDFPEEITSAQNLVIEDDTIYFTAVGAVYSMAKDAIDLPETSLFSLDGVTTLYAFDVEDDMIWTGDAKDYVSGGAVRVYSLSGDMMHEFNVGLIPNSFYFND